jgi:hypothetical protein
MNRTVPQCGGSATDDLYFPASSPGSYFGPPDRKQSTWVTAVVADPNWDQGLLCGDNARRTVRQIVAHDQISPDGVLIVSWYIADDCPDGTGCASTLSPNLG